MCVCVFVCVRARVRVGLRGSLSLQPLRRAQGMLSLRPLRAGARMQERVFLLERGTLQVRRWRYAFPCERPM